MRNYEINISPQPTEKFNIFGALLDTVLGDFTEHVLYCASVKELIPNARLDVYYRPNRPYKEAIVAMAPAIDRSWATDQPLPVNLFDVSADREPITVDDWYSLGCARPKLMILPSNGTFNHLAALPKIGRLRVPNRDAHEEALRRLVGDGWFVVLHYRELGYEFRGPSLSHHREANLEHIQPMLQYDRKGGLYVVGVTVPSFHRPVVSR